MPLTRPEQFGTEADGSRNEDYCIYCYKEGAFTSDCTMEGMIEFCAKFVHEMNRESGMQLTAEEYKAQMRQLFPPTETMEARRRQTEKHRRKGRCLVGRVP